jgi:hypothetical protein
MSNDQEVLEAAEAEIIQEVFRYLQTVVANADSEFDEEGIDCRLQLRVSGDEYTWAVHTGDSSYDQDHRGYWGASSYNSTLDEQQCAYLARELVEQALEQCACSAA